jgi:Holliday junction resolvasome RuvABC ATP-dependent DNA helicase subunit
VPTHTFVQPVEFGRLLVSIRTPGRGLVVEGPSGIGKTTSVLKALESLGLTDATTRLSARRPEDRELIAALPAMKGIGLVLIDDFHRLDEKTKELVADFLKTLADEERGDAKLIVLGINKAGDTLVRFAADLNNRIDTLHFEANPNERVLELIGKGEISLNISIETRDDIVRDAHGSFHIAQMLCHETCLLAEVMERSAEPKQVKVSLEMVRERVLDELGRAFFEPARKFASGPRLRREGRAPYLHMLNWLATGNDWSLELDQAQALGKSSTRGT